MRATHRNKHRNSAQARVRARAAVAPPDLRAELHRMRGPPGEPAQPLGSAGRGSRDAPGRPALGARTRLPAAALCGSGQRRGQTMSGLCAAPRRLAAPRALMSRARNAAAAGRRGFGEGAPIPAPGRSPAEAKPAPSARPPRTKAAAERPGTVTASGTHTSQFPSKKKERKKGTKSPEVPADGSALSRGAGSGKRRSRGAASVPPREQRARRPRAPNLARGALSRGAGGGARRGGSPVPAAQTSGGWPRGGHPGRREGPAAAARPARPGTPARAHDPAARTRPPTVRPPGRGGNKARRRRGGGRAATPAARRPAPRSPGPARRPAHLVLDLGREPVGRALVEVGHGGRCSRLALGSGRGSGRRAHAPSSLPGRRDPTGPGAASARSPAARPPPPPARGLGRRPPTNEPPAPAPPARAALLPRPGPAHATAAGRPSSGPDGGAGGGGGGKRERPGPPSPEFQSPRRAGPPRSSRAAEKGPSAPAPEGLTPAVAGKVGPAQPAGGASSSGLASRSGWRPGPATATPTARPPHPLPSDLEPEPRLPRGAVHPDTRVLSPQPLCPSCSCGSGSGPKIRRRSPARTPAPRTAGPVGPGSGVSLGAGRAHGAR